LTPQKWVALEWELPKFHKNSPRENRPLWRFGANLAFFAAILAIFAGAIEAQAKAIVEDARLGVHPDMTRFVIDMNEPVEYTIFLLSDPYRVVIDLPEVEWRLRPGQELEGLGQITGYRYGLFRPGNSRIVLDMLGPIDLRASKYLPANGGSNHRLVIDLAGTTEDIFRSKAGWPERKTALQAPSVAPPLIQRGPRDRNSKRIIVIDPGHGGVDSGAIGKSGTYEKKAVLAVAKVLKETLEKSSKYKVFLTRADDRFLELKERVNIAREKKADLFISLHADSIEKKPKVRGASVYTLDENASDKEAAALAQKENRSDLIAGVDLAGESDEVTNILIDLAQRETMNHSVLFARALMPNLGKTTKLVGNTHRFAGFRVLKAPDVPSVLIEMGYLSNATDEKNLGSKTWRKQVSGSIEGAIEHYFDNLPGAKREASASP
jgi:N-acetylmuramoyl-L-alanine amidase